MEVVLSMNISANAFAQASIQNSFINAIAAAARVTPDKVFLSKVVNKNSNAVVDISRQGTNQRRRLLTKKLYNSKRNPIPEAVEQGIHVTVNIEDADYIADIDHHLSTNGLPKSNEHVWYTPHSVTVTGLEK